MSPAFVALAPEALNPRPLQAGSVLGVRCGFFHGFGMLHIACVVVAQGAILTILMPKRNTSLPEPRNDPDLETPRPGSPNHAA